MNLSVIIPAHNAAGTIEACLESVFAHLPAATEVIVVDDGSCDNTAELAARFPCRMLSLPRNAGVSTARNAAAQLAQSEQIFFLDADVLVREDTLQQVLDIFESCPEAAAFFGSYTPWTPPLNACSQFKNLLHHYTHQNSAQEAATFCGGYGGIRKQAFLEIGGFNPSRAALEDVELGYRLKLAGHRILLVKELQMTHLKRYTLRSLMASDLYGRAIPWSELMLEYRTCRSDLNTKPEHIASVCISWLFGPLVALALAGWMAWMPFAAALALVILNFDFLRFVRCQRGWGLAAQSVCLLWIMYIICGIGVLAGASNWFRKRPAAEVSATDPA